MASRYGADQGGMEKNLAKILLVDDDPKLLRSFYTYLSERGFSITCAVNGDEALRALEKDFFDIILSDLRMPGIGGIDFLRRVRQKNPHIGFIIFTAYPTVDTAVQSLKSLADDYLEKPITDLDALHQSLSHLLIKVRERENGRLPECLVSGNPSNLALIEDLWKNIHPEKFSDFILEEQPVQGCLPALNNFIQKKMVLWPGWEYILFSEKTSRRSIFASSMLETTGPEIPCRRMSDLELFAKLESEGGNLLVQNISHEFHKYSKNRRRDGRLILLPFTISKHKGFVLFQCFSKMAVDIRLLTFLTEIISFTQWLTVVRGKKTKRAADVANYLDIPGDKDIERTDGFMGFLGNSQGMREVYRSVQKIAPTDATVLITGETGTGKELVAQTIHALSHRAGRSFVAINCSAISETLLESELFGHEKGAFTGADRTKIGLFESAEGGTIFFDEIGEISPGMQVKLLRVLQEREIRRVGSSKPRKIDVRILSSTNRNLLDGIHAHQFREDLYYRLNVISIHLPPLRERGNDVHLLIEHFLSRFAKKHHKPPLALEEKAREAAVKHPWPGNVRELMNAVEKAVILSSGDPITHLPSGLSGATPQLRNHMAGRIHNFKLAKQFWTEQFESDYLAERIKFHRGNVTATAKDMGVDTKTIWRKIRKYGISV